MLMFDYQFVSRLHVTLPVRHPIRGPVDDPPVNVSTPVGQFDRSVGDLHGPGVRLRRPLRRPRRLDVLAKIRFSAMVVGTPHSSGQFS